MENRNKNLIGTKKICQSKKNIEYPIKTQNDKNCLDYKHKVIVYKR